MEAAGTPPLEIVHKRLAARATFLFHFRPNLLHARCGPNTGARIRDPRVYIECGGAVRRAVS